MSDEPGEGVYKRVANLMPGVWVDGDGKPHLNIVGILEALGLPNTEENRKLASAEVRKLLMAEGISFIHRPKSYVIAPDGKSIKCLVCGRVSHNSEDVKQQFCANCDRFHEP